MAITYNENQFARVIAIESPPAGGDVEIEGHPIFLTGVFQWEYVVGLYEKVDDLVVDGEQVQEKFICFLSKNGQPTFERIYNPEALVLPWLFGAFGLGRILTLWRGKHHAKVRFNHYRRGGATFTTNQGAPVR